MNSEGGMSELGTSGGPIFQSEEMAEAITQENFQAQQTQLPMQHMHQQTLLTGVSVMESEQTACSGPQQGNPTHWNGSNGEFWATSKTFLMMQMMQTMLSAQQEAADRRMREEQQRHEDCRKEDMLCWEAMTERMRTPASVTVAYPSPLANLSHKFLSFIHWQKVRMPRHISMLSRHIWQDTKCP